MTSPSFRLKCGDGFDDGDYIRVVEATAVEAVAFDYFPRTFDARDVHHEDGSRRPLQGGAFGELDEFGGQDAVGGGPVHAASHDSGVDHTEPPFGVDFSNHGYDERELARKGEGHLQAR